jgi:hypothetical protein
MIRAGETEERDVTVRGFPAKQVTYTLTGLNTGAKVKSDIL